MQNLQITSFDDSGNEGGQTSLQEVVQSSDESDAEDDSEVESDDEVGSDAEIKSNQVKAKEDAEPEQSIINGNRNILEQINNFWGL